jgi:hypothetical protein
LLFQILGEALGDIYKNLYSLVRTLARPVILINLLLLIAANIPYLVINTIILLVVLFQYVVIAITTHRIILLGPASIPVWGLSRVTFREIYYSLHALVIAGLTIVIEWLLFFVVAKGMFVVAPSKLQSNFALFLLIVFASLFVSRLSLVLPGIAIDQGVSFKLSWQLTGKHPTLLFVAVVALPTLIFLGSGLIYFIYLKAYLVNNPLFVYISFNLLTFVIDVLVVTLLSVAYRQIYRDYYDKPFNPDNVKPDKSKSRTL